MDNNQSNADFLKFWEHIPWKSENETLIILKGHLLVEDLIRDFCHSAVENPNELIGARLTFYQISRLCRALSKYKASNETWECVGKLNDLRNMLAHKLEPKEYDKKKEEFIDLVKSFDKSDLFTSFSKPFEYIAVSIFITYISLSVCLRFKPQGSLLTGFRTCDALK